MTFVGGYTVFLPGQHYFFSCGFSPSLLFHQSDILTNISDRLMGYSNFPVLICDDWCFPTCFYWMEID